MKEMFDFIGVSGQILTAIITAIALLERPPYLIAFIVGTFLNEIVNSILKTSIKEDRPRNPVHYIDEAVGADIYGMPSGHAQTTFFAITYLYLVKAPPTIILICLFIGILTLYQRWSFRRHTIEQLVAGVIVGIIMANIVYQLTVEYLRRI
jgi:membrane-associated phospholipid phosphatase